MAGPLVGARSAAAIAFAVARHPSLWVVAVRQWRRTVAPRWWRTRPFLPVPPVEYLRFRLVTQNGSAGARIDPDDVLNYLAWCKRHR